MKRHHFSIYIYINRERNIDRERDRERERERVGGRETFVFSGNYGQNAGMIQ